MCGHGHATVMTKIVNSNAGFDPVQWFHSMVNSVQISCGQGRSSSRTPRNQKAKNNVLIITALHKLADKTFGTYFNDLLI